MERRNYAVMLLFVFAIVEVYSYPGELDTQAEFSTDELLLHSHQDEINDHGVASESDQQYVHADDLRRTKRNNNGKFNRPASAPTTENPAVIAARVATERSLERRTLVQQFQDSIQQYMRQGYPRVTAINRTINDNPTKANRIIELSVYPNV